MSVVVGYVPGAPLLELRPRIRNRGWSSTRRSDRCIAGVHAPGSCLTCHVSASTLDVPGLIARSNTADDGARHAAVRQLRREPRDASPGSVGRLVRHLRIRRHPYAQRAHAGNITFSRGATSNQVFVDWLNSAPEMRGYLRPHSDIVSLLVFDHQTRGSI